MAAVSQNHFGGALGGAGRKRHLNGTSGAAPTVLLLLLLGAPCSRWTPASTRTRRGRCATASPTAFSLNCTDARGVICGSAQKQACFGSMACGPSRGRGQPHRNCRAKTSRLGHSIVKFTCASYFRGKASEVVLQPKLNYAFSLAEAEVSGRGISSSRESNSRAPCITCIRTRLRRCRCLYIPRTYAPALVSTCTVPVKDAVSE